MATPSYLSFCEVTTNVWVTFSLLQVCDKAASLLILLRDSKSCNPNRYKDIERIGIGGKLKYRRCEGIIISSDPTMNIKELIPQAFYPVPPGWAESDLPLALLPLGFLIQHVKIVSRKLAALASRVSAIEKEVADLQNTAIDQTDFEDLIEKLHLYNAETVKLQRRWHFQQALAKTICELIMSHSPDENHDCAGKKKEKFRCITERRAYRTLKRTAAAQQALIQGTRYDLVALPQRISNQFTTVCH